MLINLSTVSASILFSEVYPDYDVPGMGNRDDDGHEWIEIYNTGKMADLSEWYLEDATHSFWEGNCWKLKGHIEKNGYAIIARNTNGFLTSHPDFKGNLVDTTFSINLNDDGGRLRLYHLPEGIYIGSNGRGQCAGTPADEISYTTTKPGFSIERCAYGLKIGPFEGTPGYTGCASIIPEFSLPQLIIAVMGSIVLFLIFRQ